MLEIGVVNLGLSPDEFWELSWYEWGLYILRQKAKTEEQKFDFENAWDRTRQLWAILININSPKGKGVKPSDLIKLSYDSADLSGIKRRTPEEVEAKFKKKK
jgi:hypothetical protein